MAMDDDDPVPTPGAGGVCMRVYAERFKE